MEEAGPVSPMRKAGAIVVVVGATADSSKAGAMVVVAEAAADQTEARHQVVTASSSKASIQGHRATGLHRDSSTAGQIGVVLLQVALLAGRPQQVLHGVSTHTRSNSSSNQRKVSIAAVM